MESKKYLVIILIFSSFLGIILSLSMRISFGYPQDVSFSDKQAEKPYSSSSSNIQLIEDVIDNKVEEFATKGYFSQMYEASLQSIYFALEILDSLNRLYTINESKMTSTIMSYYSPDDHYFIDRYALRYLDTDFSEIYYPLNTLLEVNCYAILALDILNHLDLINPVEFISFIWSCYQPLSSGFIGQPYSANLQTEFKIATMDNTYYAIQTLDTLLSEWDTYQTEVDELVIFINALQETGKYSGFKNDVDDSFQSIEHYSQTEPTLFSSYYCVKTLQVFGQGALTSIRVSDFLKYLNELYNEDDYYFDFTPNFIRRQNNYTNIVATAVGLELSDIYEFNNISRDLVVNFLFTNRNNGGGWNSSTEYSYHELIDTFQIIRSLRNSGDISQLTSEEKDEIIQYVELYSTFNGYTPLSEEYMSTTLVQNTISILALYNQILDLNLEDLYSSIKNSIYYSDYPVFYSIIKMDYIEIAEGKISFRSTPIEYYCKAQFNLIDEVNILASWKSAFLILDTFQKIYKLDDYETECDFPTLILKIINSQFLNTSSQYSDFFGGFLPRFYYKSYSTDRQVKYMIFEYSYYAIKTLELLNSYLGLGNLWNIGFDDVALETHITRHIVETSTELYFDPIYSDSHNKKLQNTYYAVYCLMTLNDYSLPSQKIRNFIINHLDYSDIENIYYSFKISELLDLEIDFDLIQTQELVQEIYCEEYNEFYLTTERKKIDQEIFIWICDMAKNSGMHIETTIPSIVMLGGTFDIAVELGNLILPDFGPYTSVRFESDQLGSILLEHLDNGTYYKTGIFVPMIPTNYPTISGNITIHEGSTLKKIFPFSFETTYYLSCTVSEKILSNGIRIIVNASHTFGSGVEPLYDSDVYAEIYHNGNKVSNIYFTSVDHSRFTIFTLDYYPIQGGNYEFHIFLEDIFEEQPVFITLITHSFSSLIPDQSDPPYVYKAEIFTSIPLIIGFIGAPLGVVTYTSRERLKKFFQKRIN